MSPQRLPTSQIESSLRQSRMLMAGIIRNRLLEFEKGQHSEATAKTMRHHLEALQTALDALTAPDPLKPKRLLKTLSEELDLLP